MFISYLLFPPYFTIQTSQFTTQPTLTPHLKSSSSYLFPKTKNNDKIERKQNPTFASVLIRFHKTNLVHGPIDLLQFLSHLTLHLSIFHFNLRHQSPRFAFTLKKNNNNSPCHSSGSSLVFSLSTKQSFFKKISLFRYGSRLVGITKNRKTKYKNVLEESLKWLKDTP